MAIHIHLVNRLKKEQQQHNTTQPNCQTPEFPNELPNSRTNSRTPGLPNELPNSRTPELPNSRTPGLPDSRTTKLPNYQTTKLPNYQTTKLPNYQTTKPPNHQTTKPPNHQTTKPPNHQTTKPPNHQTRNSQTAKHPERLLDGHHGSVPFELVKDGDLLLLIERMLLFGDLDTVRITKVKGHADKVWFLTVGLGRLTG